MKKTKRTLLIIAILLAVLAIACIIIGIWDGGFADVLNKAKTICYECIGLG